MWGQGACALLLTLLLSSQSFVDSAPFASSNEGMSEGGSPAEHPGTKADLTVEQLEKLKSAETAEESKGTHDHTPARVHMEMHRFDAAVKQNGEVVSHLSKEETVESVDGQKPHVHAKTELEIPNEGVHRVIVQDGAKVSVQDQGPGQPETQKEKVFRGAARLVQPSSVAGDTPPQSPAHTTTNNGNRRSFNADITRESNNNMDHFSSYTGVQYSPLDMAEYVFWTGDERGVTTAIEEFLSEGLMTKEEAIAFLQEIKFNIDYLKAHYSQQARAAAEESAQQERVRNLIMEQAAAKDMYNQMQYRNRLQSFPFGNSADIIKSIASKNYELSNNLLPSLTVPSGAGAGDYRSEMSKRTLNDPMLTTNIISTSDYDRDAAPPVSEEEFEEMMDKLRAADSLYTQYTLEEVIYQLAKMMFVQTLSHEPLESRYAMQRFMSFLESEAERGQLSRNIEKKVLDVMIAALSDTVAEHPELAQISRDGYGTSAPTNRFMHQIMDMGVSEPTLSRALLSAYKDEITKGQLMQKMKGYPAGN